MRVCVKLSDSLELEPQTVVGCPVGVGVGVGAGR